ncbi:MAG TPA: ABC transporter substrate-binding protein [Xanthobacteraceae bacterium]|nr:ABC transporter substrate-binding protein [Xanthobacteraceae bacterium]
MFGIRRRDFIALLGSAAAAWPLAARAQQAAMPVIGFLGAVSPTETARGFAQGLKESGYTEGENVAVEYRWANNQLDRLPSLAADLVRKRVAVIVAAGGTAPAIAAKATTATIPIVFTTPDDPVELGLVASLSRPGGNLTGIYFVVGELVPKRLELLRELLPAMTRVAVFVNPANPARAESQIKEAESAGRQMGLRIQIFHAGTGREINAAFATLAGERPDALLVSPDPLYVVRRAQLVTLAARHAIPTSFSNREPIEAGGLMSYGTNIADAYRQAGIYAGRILKGANPADLPVVQSSKFELVINAQTAFMLGLDVPTHLQQIADEVIE